MPALGALPSWARNTAELYKLSKMGTEFVYDVFSCAQTPRDHTVTQQVVTTHTQEHTLTRTGTGEVDDCIAHEP
jgi:hypothetical protein